MLQVGLTGGIGSGKTTVARIFSSLGIPIYYADDAAKWLMQNNEDLMVGIKALFGEDVYTSTQTLDRKKLASIVFNDRSALKQLEGLVHPAVRKHGVEWMQAQENAPYVIREAALTFETGGDKLLDKVITVFAPEEIRIQRVMARDNATLAEIKARMDKQLPDAEKVKRADFVIHNDKEQMLIPQVLEIHDYLKTLVQ